MADRICHCGRAQRFEVELRFFICEGCADQQRAQVAEVVKSIRCLCVEQPNVVKPDASVLRHVADELESEKREAWGK